MAEPGRKTDLTDELIKKIRQCILDGNDLKTTATNVFNTLEEFNNLDILDREKELANFIQKLYNWKYDNYLNLADKIEGWKRDHLIKLANDNVKEILCMDKNDKDKLKVIQDTSKSVLETLDRDNYSKRNELTGAEGKDLTIKIVNFKDDGNNATV